MRTARIASPRLLGAILREACAKRGLTQRQLAAPRRHAEAHRQARVRHPVGGRAALALRLRMARQIAADYVTVVRPSLKSLR